jgi:small subunit ribosomal protein S6
MLNNYETVFILTPVLSDEQAKETVNRYKDYLKENGATLVHEENWGLKKLAYPIKKKSSGFYSLFQFQAEGTFINDFEIAFKRDERILRFLTVSLDLGSLSYTIVKLLLSKDPTADTRSPPAVAIEFLMNILSIGPSKTYTCLSKLVVSNP